MSSDLVKRPFQLLVNESIYFGSYNSIELELAVVSLRVREWEVGNNLANELSPDFLRDKKS